MVSEEKSFESVDGRRTNDGGFPYYKLPRSLRLRGANKKLSDQQHVKKYLIFEALRLIGAVFGKASVVQTFNKYPLYGHLLPIREKSVREFILSD